MGEEGKDTVVVATPLDGQRQCWRSKDGRHFGRRALRKACTGFHSIAAAGHSHIVIEHSRG